MLRSLRVRVATRLSWKGWTLTFGCDDELGRRTEYAYDDQGRVVRVTVLSGLGHGLDQVAAETLKRFPSVIRGDRTGSAGAWERFAVFARTTAGIDILGG